MKSIIDVYKIKFKCDGWFTNSTRYFSASSASEAIIDLKYAMQHGMVSSDQITILNVAKYNRYTTKWETEDMLLLRPGYTTDNKQRIVLTKHN